MNHAIIFRTSYSKMQNANASFLSDIWFLQLLRQLQIFKTTRFLLAHVHYVYVVEWSFVVFSLGFSLNGELMMDRMGQEIAFKGIDLSSQYVPAFSLSAGQHARVNFGQVRPCWLIALIICFLVQKIWTILSALCHGKLCTGWGEKLENGTS